MSGLAARGNHFGAILTNWSRYEILGDGWVEKATRLADDVTVSFESRRPSELDLLDELGNVKIGSIEIEPRYLHE